MQPMGRVQLLRIYIDEHDQWHHQPLYLAILDLVRRKGISGATVFKAVAGYGVHGHIRQARLVEIADPLPLLIEIVETEEQIDRILPSIQEMVREGLILKEAVQVVQWTPSHPAPAQLQARDIMAQHVVTVRPETPVAEIVGLLLGRHFKGVPVVDTQQHVVGIITDTDLMTRGDVPVRLGMLAELDDEQLQTWLTMLQLSKRRAADIMTRQVVTVRPETPVLKVAQLMRDQKLKRLPVVDAQGQLVGILSRVDILRALAGRPGPVTDTGEQPAPHPGEQPTVVREIMLPDVPVVHPDAAIAVVRDRLLDSPLRRVIVIDDQRHVLGMVTDVDLVRCLTPESWTHFLQRLVQRVPNAPATAREVMTSPIQTLSPEMSISTATRMMLGSELKLLPVVDAEGRLLGAVNRSTLLTTMLDELPAPPTPPAA